MLRFPFASVVLALSGAPLIAQTTYYVDAAAVPPGSGTQGAPWPTITQALAEPGLAPGDTILVAPGTYAEQLYIDVDGITLQSTGGPLVTEIRQVAKGKMLRYAPVTSVLEGFTIAGDPSVGEPSTGISSVAELYVYDSVIRDHQEFGVETNWRVHLERCTFTGNAEAIAMWAGGNLTMRDAIVWGNAIGINQITTLYSSYSVTHCIFKWSNSNIILGSGTLQSNLHRDPDFWDPAGGDLHLKPRSNAIGAGVNGGDLGALPFDARHAPETPQVFCKSKLNSLGCSPTIGYSGTPSAGAGSMDVTCTNVVNNELGLLFYGYQCKYVTYQGGWLCVQAPARRTAAQDSGGNPPPEDCSGAYTFDFGAHIASGLDPQLVVGAPVFLQYWYRDPNSPSYSSGRSQGLAFTIQP